MLMFEESMRPTAYQPPIAKEKSPTVDVLFQRVRQQIEDGTVWQGATFDTREYSPEWRALSVHCRRNALDLLCLRNVEIEFESRNGRLDRALKLFDEFMESRGVRL